jgi:hypothetical protein
MLQLPPEFLKAGEKLRRKAFPRNTKIEQVIVVPIKRSHCKILKPLKSGWRYLPSPALRHRQLAFGF